MQKSSQVVDRLASLGEIYANYSSGLVDTYMHSKELKGIEETPSSVAIASRGTVRRAIYGCCIIHVRLK